MISETVGDAVATAILQPVKTAVCLLYVSFTDWTILCSNNSATYTNKLMDDFL